MKVTIKLKHERCMTIKIMRVIIRTPECCRSSEISRELRHNHWTTRLIIGVLSFAVNKIWRSEFDDFRAFQTGFKAFQDDTNQLFVVKKSKSVDAVNKKLDAKFTKYKPGAS